MRKATMITRMAMMSDARKVFALLQSIQEHAQHVRTLQNAKSDVPFYE